MSTAIVVDAAHWDTTLSGYYSVEIDGKLFAYQGAGQPYSIASAGDDSVRFEIHDNDRHSWDIENNKTSERNELAMRDTIAYGTPVEISYDFMMEPGDPNTAYFMVVGQLHQNVMTGAPNWSPPFAVEMIGEKMAIVIYTDGPDGTPIRNVLYTDSVDITRGEYYDMDIKAVFDPSGENGRLVVVRDGVTLVDYSGPLGYASHDSVYWSEGIYRADNASETVAAVYGNLDISTGATVTFPDPADYIAAPAFAIGTLGAADANGSRSATVSGTAKPGTTVTLYENGVAIGSGAVGADGTFSVDLGVAGSGIHKLYAVATDASGRNGVTSGALTVFVGTGADLAANYNTLMAATNLGAIVVTDGDVLTVSDAQFRAMVSSQKFNAALQTADIKYLVSYPVTGQSYDRIDLLSDKAGNFLEQSRYAGDKLVFHSVQTGDTLTTSIYAADGSVQVTVSVANVLTSLTVYNAAGIKVQDATYAGGVKTEQLTYDGVTGALTKDIVYASDGSRVETAFGITGTNYVKQVIAFGADGQIVSQQRYDGAGAIVYNMDIVGTKSTLTTWNADRSKQVSITEDGKLIDQMNFNAAGVKTSEQVFDASGVKLSSSYFDATTGALTKLITFSADGGRVETAYGITGSNYVKQVIAFGADGQILSQQRYDGAGAIVYDMSVDGTKSTLTTWAADRSKQVSISESGKLIDQMNYNAAGVKTTEHIFDTTGFKLSSSYFDATTGALNKFIAFATDGSRVETQYGFTGSNYTSTKTYYAANGTVTSVERYDASGLIVYDQDVAGSTTTVATWAADRSKVVSVTESGVLKTVTTYNAAGTVTKDVAYGANGARTETQYGITGSNYVKQVIAYGADGQIVSQQRYDGVGAIVYNMDVVGTKTTLTTWNADRSKQVSISESGKLIDQMIYNTAGVKTTEHIYDTTGFKLSSSYFDATTGVLNKFIAFATDGSRVETQYGFTGSNYTTVKTYYAAGGTVTSVERYDGTGAIVYDMDIAGTTSTLTTWNADRSKQVSITESGKLVDQMFFNAAGVKTTEHIFDTTGFKLSSSYFDATTGALNKFIAFATDGSRVETQYGFTGSNYTSTKTYYAANGTITSVERYDASGLIVYDQDVAGSTTTVATWAADRSKVVSVTESGVLKTVTTYNAAGSVTKDVAYGANGARTETQYGITGTNYVKQVIAYGADGQIVSQQRYDGAGAIVYNMDVVGTTCTLTTWNADRSKQVSISESGKLIDQMIYNAAGVKTTEHIFDTTGFKLSSSYFDATTGVLNKFIAFATDGSRVETQYGFTGSNYTTVKTYYAAGGTVTSVERYDGAGAIVYDLDVDGTKSTLTTWAADRSKQVSISENGKLIDQMIYNTAGVKTTEHIYDTTGFKLSSSYFDATTGVLNKFIAFATDGSRVETQYGFTGSNYTSTKTYYAANGSITSVERYDASGLIVYDQDVAGSTTTVATWAADRSKVVSVTESGVLKTVTTYNAAGTVTKDVAYGADGSRVEAQYGVTGTNYTTVKTYYAANGTVTSVERYDGAGAIVYDMDVDGTKSTLTTWAADRSKQVSISESGKLIDQMNYNAAGVKTTEHIFDTTGFKLSSSYFDATTGALNKFIAFATDGSRVETQYGFTGSNYTSVKTYYAANSAVTSVERYDASGLIVYDQDVVGNTTTVATWATDRSKVVSVTESGVLKTVTTYSAAGTVTKDVAYGADGSRVEAQYGVTGTNYTTVKTYYAANSTVTSVERYDAAGQMVYDRDIDGTHSTLATWNADRSSQVSVYEGTKLTSQANYDSDGTKVSDFTFDANGARTTASYYDGDTGALTKAIVYGADGSRAEHQYGITGTTYTEQALNYDATGKLVFQERYTADGSKVSTMTAGSDGSTHTSYYDTSGRVTSENVLYADGAKDTIVNTYADGATLPATSLLLHYEAGTNKLAWSDQANADGSHTQASYLGAVLHSHDAVADVFYGASSASDTFVITGSSGRDVISGFQSGSGAVHDVLVVDDFTSFDDLMAHAATRGNDVVITMNDHDSVVLQNVTLASLTQDNFHFGLPV